MHPSQAESSDEDSDDDSSEEESSEEEEKPAAKKEAAKPAAKAAAKVRPGFRLLCALPDVLLATYLLWLAPKHCVTLALMSLLCHLGALVP
jgi:hypothetical protein